MAANENLLIDRPVSGCFYIRDRGRFWRIENADVLFIEARKSLCRIQTREKLWVVTGRISAFEASLPPDEFGRIHRSFIIGWRHLQSFDQRVVYLPGYQLPIGDSYRSVIEQRFLIIQHFNVSRGARVQADSDVLSTIAG